MRKTRGFDGYLRFADALSEKRISVWKNEIKSETSKRPPSTDTHPDCCARLLHIVRLHLDALRKPQAQSKSALRGALLRGASRCVIKPPRPGNVF